MNIQIEHKDQIYPNYAIGQSTILIRNIQSNKVISVKRDGSIYQYQFTSDKTNLNSIAPFTCAVDKKKNRYIQILNHSVGVDMSIRLTRFPIEVIGCRLLVIGGQWNGWIRVINMENNQLMQECRDTEHTVTVLSTDKEQNQLVVGDRIGTIIIYQINKS